MENSTENQKTLDTLNQLVEGSGKLIDAVKQKLLNEKMQFEDNSLNREKSPKERHVPLTASGDEAYAKSEHYSNMMGIEKEKRNIPEDVLKKIYEDSDIMVDTVLSDYIDKLLGFDNS